jgi:hypothetical protein
MKQKIKYCKLISALCISILAGHCYAQKTKYERIPITYYKMPSFVLDSTYKTYSVSANIPDYMGGNYAAANISYTIQGLKKVATTGDIEILLNYPYYKLFTNTPPQINTTSRTNKEKVTTTTYSKSCTYEQGYEYKIVNNKTGNFQSRWAMSLS